MAEAESDKIHDLQYSENVETVGPLEYAKGKPAQRNYTGLSEAAKKEMQQSQASYQEQRLYAILGNDSLSNGFLDLGGIFKPSELSARMIDIAKTNPTEYAELQRIAQNIINSYERDKNSVSKKAYNLSRNIRMNNWSNGTVEQVPQKLAVQNNNSAKQMINTNGLSGKQIHENMKKLLEYIDYEAKMYESIPALPVNQNAIDASRQRYNNYINTYNKYIDLINGYIQSGTNPAIIYEFLAAYQSAPLSQHTEAELKALAKLVSQYEIKKQLADENDARTYATETDSEYNFMDK